MPSIQRARRSDVTRSLPRQSARYNAPALEKGLDILEAFAREPAGLSGSEVARRLGRSVGEIFRMLVCLERRGYICETSDKDRYELTLKLFELANRHHPLERLVGHARPLLQQVANHTEQSCHLAMVSDGAVIVVAQANAPGIMGFSLRLGAQVDLFDTASGHVILAFQSEPTRQRALAAWERRTRRRAPRGLSKHLEAIRTRGYEEVASYQVRGVINISFPVFNQHGEAIAALSVPFIRRVGERISPRQVKSSLQLASTRLTADIGGQRTLLLSLGGKRDEQD